ncbi:MAG: DegT/DnrJ/EryC1/StrS aminotransferase family protein [Gammaproteobacteria bacterium]|nr:DegT/DnrJ/EryC1/StrS aminotransferase family protein [Gammaproteobacteria bacterium]
MPLTKTRSSFIPVAKLAITQKAIQQVNQCLKENESARGQYVEQFVTLLKNHFKMPHVVPVASPAAALHLILRSLLDPEYKNEIITTPLAFPAAANAIALTGARPIFIDINPQTLSFDVEQIRSKINKNTRAILPIHLAGLPVDLDPIYDLAKRHNLRVIEDASNALGARYKNREIGHAGDIVVLGFGADEEITVDGGACVMTRDEKLAKQIAVGSFYGMDTESRYRYEGQSYDIEKVGYKYNMSDIQAIIGMDQLENMEKNTEKRTKLALRYQEKLKNIAAIQLLQFPSYSFQHAWHSFNILINADKTDLGRDEFITIMKTYHIETEFHYDVIHLFHYYEHYYNYLPGYLPDAELAASRLVSLPLFPSMSYKEQDRVIKAVEEVLATVKGRKYVFVNPLNTKIRERGAKGY